MALLTYEQALAEVRELKDHDNPDLAYELADAMVPVYYNEILADWTSLPMEYSDTWQGMADITAGTTIFDLMQIDLLNYYETLYNRALEEVNN